MRPTVLVATLLLLAGSLPAEVPNPPTAEPPKKVEADDDPPEIQGMLRQMPAHVPPEVREQMIAQARQMFKFHRQQFARRDQAPFPPRFDGGMPWPNRECETPAAASRLGARLEAPPAALADQLDLPRGQGLLLTEVESDSAAAKAGLKRNDVLLELDGKPVPRDVG